MNSIQLSQVLKRNWFTRPWFKGVFSADQLRSFHTYPHCFVANTDVSAEPGKHWVAFYIQNPTTVEYFDSLGEWPPRSKHLFDYIRLNYENIMYNNKKIQASYEDACGPYSIYFLVNRCGGGFGRRRSFYWIIDTLYKNPFSAVFVKLFVMKLQRVYYK